MEALVAAGEGAQLAAERAEVEAAAVARRLLVHQPPRAVEEVRPAEAEPVDVDDIGRPLVERRQSPGDQFLRAVEAPRQLGLGQRAGGARRVDQRRQSLGRRLGRARR